MTSPTPLDIPPVDIRPAGSRFHTRIDWLDSWHSFSFGPHHDPTNTGHGLLLVNNDDTVAPGGGFGAHSHRDMEIVTWVLEGELEHRDSIGTQGVITPGMAQRMTAGSGITHSEQNASRDLPVHFVQMWVPPDRRALEPGYEQLDVTDALGAGGLVAVASGRGHTGAVELHQQGAVLWAARLDPGATVEIPDAPHVHVFVARGSADLAGAPLGPGDAARLTAAGALALTAGDGGEVDRSDRAGEGTEVLVWETD